MMQTFFIYVDEGGNFFCPPQKFLTFESLPLINLLLGQGEIAELFLGVLQIKNASPRIIYETFPPVVCPCMPGGVYIYCVRLIAIAN